MQLTEALKTRKAIFQDFDLWTTIHFQSPTRNSPELLLDLLLQIPSLLERADQLKLHVAAEREDFESRNRPNSGRPPGSWCVRVVQYLQDCDDLLHRLHDWLDLLRDSENGHLWGYFQSFAFPIKLQRSERMTIYFSSPRIPGLIINYWSGILELSAGILEIRELFGHSMEHTVLHGLLRLNSPSTLINWDSSSILSMHICQTLMYLSSSLVGRTMAYIPAGLAEAYFTRLLSTSYRRACEHDSEILREYDGACIGLECCQKALEMLKNIHKIMDHQDMC